MKISIYLLLLVVLLFAPCSNENSSLDCDTLKTSLVEKDEAAAKALLNPELENFTFLDQDNNFCLHDRNLNAFRDLINDNCNDTKANILCCSCIETFPTISEITIELDSLGTTVSRTLDISTPDEGPLSIVGIH